MLRGCEEIAETKVCVILSRPTSLRGCEEITRRRVGVTLSEKGPNCRGGTAVRPQLSGDVESCQGCGRTAGLPPENWTRGKGTLPYDRKGRKDAESPSI